MALHIRNLDAATHRLAKMAAAARGETLEQFVAAAIKAQADAALKTLTTPKKA